VRHHSPFPSNGVAMISLRLQLEKYQIKVGFDSTGNAHLNCPYCTPPDQGQHLYIQEFTVDSGIAYRFQCWKCGKIGRVTDLFPNAIRRILRYNQKIQPERTGSSSGYTPKALGAISGDVAFDKRLLKWLIKSRNFSLKEAIKLVERYGLVYKDGKVFFSCKYNKRLMFVFHKDIESNRYMNVASDKFAFNMDVLTESKADYVVLTEGVFDCLRLSVNNIPAIALLGKSFGPLCLVRFQQDVGDRRIFIMLDGDIRKNEDRKLRSKLRLNIRNRIQLIHLTEDDDPDEKFQKRKAVKELKKYLNSGSTEDFTI
jgi:hypothetical protein